MGWSTPVKGNLISKDSVNYLGKIRLYQPFDSISKAL